MRGPLLAVEVEPDHLCVRIHASCTLQYSDDQQVWHDMPEWKFGIEEDRPDCVTFRDRTVPLNQTRSYRATEAQRTETVTASLNSSTYLLKPLVACPTCGLYSDGGKP